MKTTFPFGLKRILVLVFLLPQLVLAQVDDFIQFPVPEGPVQKNSVSIVTINQELLLTGSYEQSIDMNGQVIVPVPYTGMNRGVFVVKYAENGIPLVSKNVASGRITERKIGAESNGKFTYLLISFKDSIRTDSLFYVDADTNTNVCILKLDENLNEVWSALLLSDCAVDIGKGNSFAIDIDSNLYISGSAYCDLIYDTTVIPITTNLGFVLKVSSDGQIRWNKKFGSTAGYNESSALTTDSAKNVYVLNYLAPAWQTQIDTATLSLFPMYTLLAGVLTKFDSSGTLQWMQHYGMNATWPGFAPTFIRELNSVIYIAGVFTGPFGSNLIFSGQGSLAASPLKANIFTARYSKSGQFISCAKSSDPNFIELRWLSKPNSGRAMLSGSFGGNFSYAGIKLTEYSSDVFILAVDKKDSLCWFEAFGGDYMDNATQAEYTAQDEVYILGLSNSQPAYFGSLNFVAGMNQLFVVKGIQYPLSTLQEQSNNGIVIYPNPVNSLSYLEMNLYADAEINLSLTDAFGKKMMGVFEDYTMQQSRGKKKFTLRTNHLASGIYYCIVEINGQKQVLHLSVIH